MFFRGSHRSQGRMTFLWFVILLDVIGCAFLFRETGSPLLLVMR
jgi:hypothetical protein